MLDFALANADALTSIYHSLPAFLRDRLVEQLAAALSKDEEPRDVRALAAFRVLRRLDPDLPPIKGTEPGAGESGWKDFMAIATRSEQQMGQFLDDLEAATQTGDWNSAGFWSGLSSTDLEEFNLGSDDNRPD